MKRPRLPKHQHLTDKDLTLACLKATPKQQLAPDENLALEYLVGKFVKDHHDKITYKFHKPGSEEEARSRAALIKLLREYRELNPVIRFCLAELLDPDSPMEERIFTITNRRPWRQPCHALTIEIARFIALQIAEGRKVESAKQEAKDLYRDSMSTIERAWADHKDSDLIGPMWKWAI